MTASDGAAPAAGVPPAWTRRPANLASAVAAELVSRIVRGQHPEGAPLPPEPALCETFSVSRTVVREAVKMLQEKGLVQVRQGAGTTVTPRTMWNLLDELVLAATIAEEDGLDVLDDLVALVDRMDELVGDHVAYADHDRAFHDVVMRTSGNRIARAVVRALESQVIHSVRYMGHPHREQCVASNRGHRQVYERIAARDPAGAAEAMFTHITEAWLVRRGGPGEPVRLHR